MPHIAIVKDVEVFILQFNVAIPCHDTKKLQRILGYGNPVLFGTLNRKVQVFINGTFCIVPRPFYHFLIIMIFYVQTEVYVSVIHILITIKSKALY